MEQVLLFSTIIAVIVATIIEMIKVTADKKLPANYIPFIAFLVGLIVGAVAYPFTDLDLVNRLWAGAISGWMASGLYDTVKRTTKL